MDTISLLSVNVGVPNVIGTSGGSTVISSIGKTPVKPDVLDIPLRISGLPNNRQSRAKEGQPPDPDRAICVYPSEHLSSWYYEVGRLWSRGMFGENLTIAGITEDTARIGDVWLWGNAILQITRYRCACARLDTFLGVPDMKQRMIRTGRCGWYLRVVQQGMVPAAGPILVAERIPDAPTVAEVFRARYPLED